MKPNDKRASEPQVFVIDIPVGTSAEEMADILNRQYVDGGVYLNSVLQWPGTGARAVFRRLVNHRATPGPTDGEAAACTPANEAAALDVLRAHPHLSCRATAQLIKARGFNRGKDWVLIKRKELARTR